MIKDIGLKNSEGGADALRSSANIGDKKNNDMFLTPY